jgi:hypothetical protein
VDVSQSGVGANDHAIVNPDSNLPDGIIIAYCYAPSDNIIRIGLLNATQETIKLSVKMNLISFRRFF